MEAIIYGIMRRLDSTRRCQRRCGIGIALQPAFPPNVPPQVRKGAQRGTCCRHAGLRPELAKDAAVPGGDNGGKARPIDRGQRDRRRSSWGARYTSPPPVSRRLGKKVRGSCVASDCEPVEALSRLLRFAAALRVTGSRLRLMSSTWRPAGLATRQIPTRTASPTVALARTRSSCRPRSAIDGDIMRHDVLAGVRIPGGQLWPRVATRL